MYTLLHDLAVQSVIVRSLPQGGAQLCPALRAPRDCHSPACAQSSGASACGLKPKHALAINCRTRSTEVQQQAGSRPQLNSRLPARSQPLPARLLLPSGRLQLSSLPLPASLLLPSGQPPARGQALPGRRPPAGSTSGAHPAWWQRWRPSCRPSSACMASLALEARRSCEP